MLEHRLFPSLALAFLVATEFFACGTVPAESVECLPGYDASDIGADVGPDGPVPGGGVLGGSALFTCWTSEMTSVGALQLDGPRWSCSIRGALRERPRSRSSSIGHS
jgi:hypothetical protein